MKRNLKEIQLVPGKKMQFKEFRKINDNYPMLFYPAFRLQHTLKTKFLGIDWWFFKLQKYTNVRRKLAAGSSNTDIVAATEIARYKDDQQRDKRMKDRAEDIRLETSSVRKAILQARQFLDEVT